MRPLHLALQNFLSFEDAEVDLGSLGGLVLLSGTHEGGDTGADSNGAGKSALIDGICWALYGKLTRPRHRAEDVIRRAAGQGCIVRLSFTDAQGRTVEVTRFRKHPRHKDALHLLVDGEEARASSSAETQARIDALVGLDHDAFVGSVLYTQHPLRGRFAELPDDQKKTLLESILGAEVLSVAREITKRRLRTETLEAEKRELAAGALRDQIAWLERQHGDYLARAASWDEAQRGRVETLRGQLASLHLDLEQLRRREPALPASTSIVGELAAAMAALGRIDTEARKDDAALERRVAAVRASAASARALLARLQDEAGKLAAPGHVCPVCAQPMPRDRREAHRRSLEAEQAEQARIALESRAEAQRLEADRAAARERWAAERSHQEEVVDTLRAAAETERLARAEHTAWERELAALERRIADVGAQLDAAATEQNAFRELATRAAADRDDKAAALTEVEGELGRLRGSVERLTFWERGFGPRGLKSYLLDSVLPVLNERARFYADLLTAGALSVRFSTTVEKDDGLEERFTVQIQHRNGVDSYALLSGGERQRVNLIVNLALQDLVGSRAARPLPIAIYDEAFEGLDRTGIEAAMRVLTEAARTKELVLVVTHQPALADLFAHELRVVSDRGISRIETVS